MAVKIFQSVVWAQIVSETGPETLEFEGPDVYAETADYAAKILEQFDPTARLTGNTKTRPFTAGEKAAGLHKATIWPRHNQDVYALYVAAANSYDALPDSEDARKAKSRIKSLVKLYDKIYF